MCIFYSCECHVPRSVESAGYILDPIASLTRSSFNCNAWDFLVCIGSPSQGKIIGRITLKPLVVVPQQNQFHEALPRTSLSKLQSLSCLRVGGGTPQWMKYHSLKSAWNRLNRNGFFFLHRVSRDIPKKYGSSDIIFFSTCGHSKSWRIP